MHKEVQYEPLGHVRHTKHNCATMHHGPKYPRKVTLTKILLDTFLSPHLDYIQGVNVMWDSTAVTQYNCFFWNADLLVGSRAFTCMPSP